ncbi:radical SAM family heme chaperone HemW [Altererythrobacter sp. MF3-039]|uniref:radical SAM family heme chaperone HemW n=1 Tax=Altererythrobacter sp. MF3-039 TaxID=3252901 RepID=UPI00390CBEC3
MARALYIHWPFCIRKCPYCDFNSHVRETVDHVRWKDALLADMRFEAGLTGGEALESVFFGGGTPSLMAPETVAALLSEAKRLWGFAPDIEITLEANPSSVEAARFAALAEAGVNRVSLGLQSFDDVSLQFLGRLHSAREGLEALEVAQASFGRVSFDLIYALPDQTERQWQEQLNQALALGTGHLSLYQLTIEPNTRFATDVRRGVFDPLADDPAADLFVLTRERTAQAGLPAYETSNHARPGEESRHNLAYWRYHDYVGIGPGAHGRRCGQATQRHKKPENWIESVEKQGHGIKDSHALSAREQASEALLMGLRLTEGVDLDEFAARFDVIDHPLISLDKCQIYRDHGLVALDGARLRVTEKGAPLLDGLLAELVSDRLVAA